ncbi:hypothetical protein [Tropicimonas sp. IMCC34011]|uniref:hypothetical protein n=1 Tax=Tropicimonas sp. IMCC34011 TaxID=2248759 RepID=UPI0013005948|nr:hypothetical protein [Tropicimonas sp. IMCC34011]
MKKVSDAGTTIERIPIPRERLRRVKQDVFDTHTELSATVEALTAVLPRMQDLFHSARQALNFARAIQHKLDLFGES